MPKDRVPKDLAASPLNNSRSVRTAEATFDTDGWLKPTQAEGGGATLDDLAQRPGPVWVVEAFQHSLLDVAGTGDLRTAILQIFVYISLAFTLLTIPFVLILKRELDRRGITIRLAGRST